MICKNSEKLPFRMATLTIVQKLDLGFGFLVFWGAFLGYLF